MIDSFTKLVTDQTLEDLAVDLHPVGYLELYNFGDDKDAIVREGELQVAGNDSEQAGRTIGDWLARRGDFKQPELNSGVKPRSELRVLYQQWTRSGWEYDYDAPRNRPVPFQTYVPIPQDTLRIIVEELDLSRDFVWSCSNSRCNNSPFESIDGNLKMFAHFDSQIVLALTYNPRLNSTSIYLLTISPLNFQQVRGYLKSLPAAAEHPLFILTVLLNYGYRALSERTKYCKGLVRSVLRNSGLLGHRTGPTEDEDPDMTLGQIHEALVRADYVSMGISEKFMKDFAESTLLCFGTLGNVLASTSNEQIMRQHKELFRHAKVIKSLVDLQLNERAMLRHRVDVHHKVLYNSMQQKDTRISQSLAADSKNIAEAARRDSSVMKSIAALTMVFIPGTAVATIFSMSAFFETSGGGSLHVTSSFYVYWAVTIPLTVIVVISWFLWLWLSGRVTIKRRVSDAGHGESGERKDGKFD